MKFFERRRTRKLLEHYLAEVRHARAYREDVAEAAALDRLAQAEKALQDPALLDDADKRGKVFEETAAAVRAVRPAPASSLFRRWAEDFEIIVVAGIVAMGFRTYFIQPFKIPTGSMQPTLYGIIVDGAHGRPGQGGAALSAWDRFPLSWLQWAVLGRGYVEVRAKDSGTIERGGRTDGGDYWMVRGRKHLVRDTMMKFHRVGDYVVKGELVASGRVTLGDHIFVNRMKYFYSRPSRGDIAVFETTYIDHPQVQKDSPYIKRMVGMPGETMSIDAPYLLANGNRITEPYHFQRQVNREYDGAKGYAQAGRLAHPGLSIKLGPREYLMMGDHTTSSLDGRYFGGIPEESLVGPAFFVYWPFSERWGIIR